MAIEVKTAADVWAVKEKYELTFNELAQLTGMSWTGLQKIVSGGYQHLSPLSRIRIQQIANELEANPPVRPPRRHKRKGPPTRGPAGVTPRVRRL